MSGKQKHYYRRRRPTSGQITEMAYEESLNLVSDENQTIATGKQLNSVGFNADYIPFQSDLPAVSNLPSMVDLPVSLSTTHLDDSPDTHDLSFSVKGMGLVYIVFALMLFVGCAGTALITPEVGATSKIFNTVQESDLTVDEKLELIEKDIHIVWDAELMGLELGDTVYSQLPVNRDDWTDDMRIHEAALREGLDRNATRTDEMVAEYNRMSSELNGDTVLTVHRDTDRKLVKTDKEN